MRRDDIHHILVIGSGPIVIGQACEFDYSGNQAVRALKEEGYEVSLINPNPATVMTTPGIADHIFLEPLKKEYIERIFDQVGPDAILSTMGGQTALNLTMELEKEGILGKYGVKVIGASADAIEKAEDRGKFKEIITSLGYESARSGIAHSIGGFTGYALVTLAMVIGTYIKVQMILAVIPFYHFIATIGTFIGNLISGIITLLLVYLGQQPAA